MTRCNPLHGAASAPRRATIRLCRGRSIASLLVAASGIGSATGCQSAYFLTDPERKQAVPAEYRDLASKKVAIVVWAEQATLDMDALARHRVAESVKYHLESNIRSIRVVDPADVSRYQERHGMDWEAQGPQELCKQFDSDVILRIDLWEYTTRAQDARELRKGRIRGSVTVYGRDQPRDADPLYSGEAAASYPEGSQGVLDQSDGEILRTTLDQFGRAVARKFHDHEISYTKTGDRPASR